MRTVSILVLGLFPCGLAYAQETAPPEAPVAPTMEQFEALRAELKEAKTSADQATKAAAEATKAATAAHAASTAQAEAQAMKAEAPAGPSTGPELTFSVFADAYGSFNTAPVGADYSTTPFHRAYAHRNGFSLSFGGVDAAVEGDQLGATLSLRFGPSVPVFFGGQPEDGDGPLGLENVFQAYGTWQPTDALTIDLGQFGTIYGAEVAESWANLNYTRGGLYFAMQPFWHTGLRANYAVSDTFGVTAMVVNGVNNAVDENGSPSVGIQAAYGDDTVGLIVGYLGALEPESSADGFHHFGDVVFTVASGDFSLVTNFDVGLTQGAAANDGDALWFGGSAAAGYAFTEQVGVAVRGEYLVDNDNILYGAAGAESVSVGTGTLTLDIKPIKDSDNVILRWDNRFESSDAGVFLDRNGAASNAWFSSTVGLVVKSS